MTRELNRHSLLAASKEKIITSHNDFLTTQTRFIPVTQFPNHHPWPPIGGLRHLIFNAKTNGFDAVIKRAGRRVLIDEQAFFSWLDQQNTQGGANHART